MYQVLAAVAKQAVSQGVKSILITCARTGHVSGGKKSLHYHGQAIDIQASIPEYQKTADVIVPYVSANAQILGIDQLVYGKPVLGKPGDYFNYFGGSPSKKRSTGHETHIHIGVKP